MTLSLIVTRISDYLAWSVALPFPAGPQVKVQVHSDGLMACFQK